MRALSDVSDRKWFLKVHGRMALGSARGAG